ncbi:hypothetical protein GGR54DRAFT_494464 [Hypoxylon sp. NC1633]|nr:hypothetical protein GGR54DRAFT_494464 [Hypoxylon sp. NC1633]
MASSDTHTSLQDSPDNHGSVVNLVSWFLLICSSLHVLTRLGMKWGVSKTLHIDDGMVVVALILSISQTIATSIAVGNGLGQHINVLSDDNIAAFQKSYYSANILFVASQAFSKLSVIFFVRVISPNPIHKTLAWVLTVATLLWTFSSIPALVFSCDTPRVWDFLTNKCVNQAALWDYINVGNIVLDACLIWLPLTVVWGLQAQNKRKLILMTCFGTRGFTIAAVIWQMVESQQISNHDDATFTFWPIVLSMSLAQCLGIMAACAPYLKPFLDSLESGLIRSDDIRRRANATGKGGSYAYGGRSKEAGSSNPRSVHAPSSHELRYLGTANSRVTAITVGKPEGGADWETGSHTSQVKLIKQVKTWGVITSSPEPERAVGTEGQFEPRVPTP